MVKAHNKVSMWPPAFRLVEPINLSLNSRPHTRIPIHIFFVGEPRSKTRLQTANQCSQEMDFDSEINMQTHVVDSCQVSHSINLWLCHTIFNKSYLTLSPHTSLRLTSGLKAGVSLRGIAISLSSLPVWISTSILLSLSLTHLFLRHPPTLFSPYVSYGPQLSFGILYSRKHDLWRCRLSPTTTIPPAPSSLINIQYIPTSARHHTDICPYSSVYLIIIQNGLVYMWTHSLERLSVIISYLLDSFLQGVSSHFFIWTLYRQFFLNYPSTILLIFKKLKIISCATLKKMSPCVRPRETKQLQ